MPAGPSCTRKVGVAFVLVVWSVVLGEISPPPGLTGLTVVLSLSPLRHKTGDTKECDIYHVPFTELRLSLPNPFYCVQTSENSIVHMTVNPLLFQIFATFCY